MQDLFLAKVAVVSTSNRQGLRDRHCFMYTICLTEEIKSHLLLEFRLEQVGLSCFYNALEHFDFRLYS